MGDAELDALGREKDSAEREAHEEGREHAPGLEMRRSEERAAQHECEQRADPRAQGGQQALAVEQLLEERREHDVREPDAGDASGA